MAVRQFVAANGDELTLAVGALDTMEYGAVAILLRRAAVGRGDQEHFCNLHDSGGIGRLAVWIEDADDDLSWRTDAGGGGNSDGGGPALNTTTDYYLAIGRKPTGSNVPRWSVQNRTTGTWDHGDGNTAVADATAAGAGGTVRFNFQGNANSFFNSLIAIQAAWNNRLGPSDAWTADAAGDAAIEAAGLEIAASNWANASPNAGWLFNQDSVSDPVTDFTGNGADQTSISGTTVVTGDDPPGFSFDLDGSAGTASGSYGYTGTAAGQATVLGSASGSYAYAGTAQGQATVLGSASGSYAYAGAASGQATVIGSASGTYGYEGTAIGTGEATGVEPIILPPYREPAVAAYREPTIPAFREPLP